MIKCRFCQKDKPQEDFLLINGKLFHKCFQCRQEYNKATKERRSARYQVKKEEIIQKQKEYAALNKEKIRQRKKQYRLENKERLKLESKERYANSTEEAKLKGAFFDDPEKLEKAIKYLKGLTE